LTRPVALVTGASSGLGLELATIAARDGHDLVLVARRRDRLESIAKGLREEFGAAVTIIVRDLAESEAARVVAQEVEARGLSVELLVNNAGLGVHGPFAETPLDRELAMIRVNLVALTELTKRVLPEMIARGRGRILNVASTAAFQPGPLMAVYYATKAYVLSFSEAIASEVAGSGVTVTALCPGPTRTEFGKAAGMLETRLFRSPLVRDARSVAEAGYRGMKRGRRVVIPGIGNWILAEAVRFTPRRLVTAVSLAVQKTRR
jgi:short-subunit dehydrogenase